MKEFFKKVVLFVCVFVGLLTFVLGSYTIKTGQVGIVRTFGKVSAFKQEGLHFKIPIVQSVIKMTTREQTMSFAIDGENQPISVSTKDMQTIMLELTVSELVHDPEKLFRAFSGNHVNSLIVPRVKDSVQTNISRYTIEDFVAKRPELAKDIENELKAELEPYGITVTNVSIVNHDFSDAYENAIEAKKVAEQAVETEKQLQNKKIIEAQSAVELARLEIERKKLQAEANKVETSSLSDKLLTKMWLEKWDGKLPQVTSDKSTIMLPFEK